MSDLRPSGGEIDGAAQLLASARLRVASTAADLALPEGFRLNEWQRTTVGALLVRLVRAVEDELRAALAGSVADPALHAALSSAHVEIAMPALGTSGVLGESRLVEALLRRAEEHRLQRAGAADTALLVELAGDRDEWVASEAMALLIAQSGRLDPFREPLLPRSDLSAEVEHHLVWTVAAALRRYMIDRHGADPATTDESLSAAARLVLTSHDEGATMDARCRRLATALRDAGRLDDSLALRSLNEATLPFFVAILASRSGLDADAVWELLPARSGRGAVLLLRAAAIARSEAGGILFTLAGDETQLAAQLDLFDGIAAPEAGRLLTLWRTDPGYRAAVARLT
jgi:uncharacterized protein (DUF2336 family)